MVGIWTKDRNPTSNPTSNLTPNPSLGVVEIMGLRASSKAPLFNYIVQLEGSFYVNRAVLRVCGLSYSPSCCCRVLNHLQRQDTQAKHTNLYPVANATDVLNSYQYPRRKDHVQ